MNGKIVLSFTILVVILIISGCVAPQNLVNENKISTNITSIPTTLAVQMCNSSRVLPKSDIHVETSGIRIYLFHNGGDPILKECLLVRVNGHNIYGFYSLLNYEKWPWTKGKTLQVAYYGDDKLNSIQLIDACGCNQTILFSHSF
jgi:hypothetical protein